MKTIIEIIKGILIGIANIIPGVSGGTLAIVMGIYNKLIDAVNDFFKAPIKAIKSVWVYIVGIGIGVCGSIIGVSYFLEKYPIPITMLFIGLIVGAIPLMISQVDNKKIEKKDIISFCVLMIIILLLPFISTQSATDASTGNFFMMFIMGIIAAFSIVVPGVSGSMLLMTFGYYKPIADLASEVIKSILKFDIGTVFSDGLVLIPFAIGLILGVILTAKLIKYLLDKFSKAVNWGVLGLIVASPFPVILGLDIGSAKILNILLGIVTFGVGAITSNLLTKIKTK